MAVAVAAAAAAAAAAEAEAEAEAAELIGTDVASRMGGGCGTEPMAVPCAVLDMSILNDDVPAAGTSPIDMAAAAAAAGPGPAPAPAAALVKELEVTDDRIVGSLAVLVEESLLSERLPMRFDASGADAGAGRVADPSELIGTGQVAEGPGRTGSAGLELDVSKTPSADLASASTVLSG